MRHPPLTPEEKAGDAECAAMDAAYAAFEEETKTETRRHLDAIARLEGPYRAAAYARPKPSDDDDPRLRGLRPLPLPRGVSLWEEDAYRAQERALRLAREREEELPPYPKAEIHAERVRHAEAIRPAQERLNRRLCRLIGPREDPND